MNTRDAERQELERAIELLGRSTRPGRLLEFLGAKYFHEQEGQLTEFNIATAVFGRSEKNFDPTEDAVVRVEAHRLRKKLKEIYEKDGRTHGLQISLPAGTYAPKFTAAAEPLPASPASPAGSGHRPQIGWLSRVPMWVWSLAIVAVVAIVIASAVMKGRSPIGQSCRAAIDDHAARPVRGRNQRRDHRAAHHVRLQWQ